MNQPPTPLIASSLLLPYTDFNLIGICGHAGTGKDTLAEALCKEFTDTYSEALASPVKEVCAHLYGLDIEHFHSRELKEVTHPFWNMSPREMAQYVGTDLVRLNLGSGHWIRRMHGKLSGAARNTKEDGDYCDGDTVIITDIRFQNEYDYVINNGGIIFHLSRPGYDGAVGIPDHPSEDLKAINFHKKERTYCLINDSTIPDLTEKAALAMEYNFPKLVRKSISSSL